MKSLFVHLYKAIMLFVLLSYSNIIYSQTCNYVWFTNSTNGCTVNFNGQVFGDPAEIDNWFWEFGDGATSNLQQATHTFNESGCYFVVLSINDGESYFEEEICISCQDDEPDNNDNTGPFNLSIEGPNSVFISNLAYSYTANVSGGTPPYQYSWSKNIGSCGSLGNSAPEVDFNTGNCIIPEIVTIELCVTDYVGNEGCTTQEVILNAQTGDCDIKVSGALEIDETVHLRIKDNIFGPDCYDAYRYWTWDYGDDVVEGPMFWITEHSYAEDGNYMVTATGCIDPYDQSNCITVNREVTIGDVIPDSEIPNFGIDPEEDITINLGEVSTTNNAPLSVNVIDLPLDLPNQITFSHYVMEWTIRNHMTGVEVDQYTSIEINPEDLSTSLNDDFVFTPSMDAWGCLDVELRITPWGEYNGQIDTNCDNMLNDLDDVCSNGGSCIGYIGVLSPVDLSKWHEGSAWGGGSPHSGCVAEGEFGYEFPFTVIEQCKIEVIPHEPEIIDISIVGDCDPYLSVQTTLGAQHNVAVPESAPCGGVQDFPEYRWQAFSIFNPSEEIEIFIDNDGARKCIAIDFTHDYFTQFDAGEQPTFICRIEVEDHFGLKDTYVKPIVLSSPLMLQMPTEIRRCPGTLTELFDGNEVTGGSGEYIFDWGDIEVFISGDFPDFQLDLLNNPNPFPEINTTLVVTDENDDGCSLVIPISLIQIPLTVTNVPDLMYACSDGPGENTLGADVYGGSGNYTYLWSPSNHLDDPTDLNTTLDFVIPTPDGQAPTATYTLLVTDEYGCTRQSNPVTVEGRKNDLQISAGLDRNVCYGISQTIGVPSNQDAYFYWTSDNEHFEGGVVTPITLSESLNSYPGDYTYTLHGVSIPSGCVSEDEVNITVREQWAYNGYESSLHTTIIGEGEIGDPVDLWSSNPNDFLSSSGHVGAFNYGWTPDDPSISVTSFNDESIPSEGTFIPSPSLPYVTLNLRDEVGCRKDLKSNRYVVLDAEPSINISSEDGITICALGVYHIDIELDARFKGDGSALLPPFIEVEYEIDNQSIGDNFQLTLVNGEGLYRGTFDYGGFGNIHGAWGPHYFRVTVTDDNNLFQGLSGGYFFEYGVIDPGSPVPESEIVCGSLWGATSNPDPLDPNFSAEAMNIIIGVNSGNCTETFVHELPLLFRAGRSIVIRPDHEFDNIDQLGEQVQLLAYIDPCLVEEFTDDEEESKLLVENTEEEKTERRHDEIESVEKKEELIKQEMIVYPNPFTGEVTIEYSLDLEERTANVSLNLLSIAGVKLGTVFSNQTHSSGSFKATYDGSQLPPGMYYYELIIDNQRLVKKVVKATF